MLVDAPLLAPVLMLVLCGVFNKFQLGVLLLSLFFSQLLYCVAIDILVFSALNDFSSLQQWVPRCKGYYQGRPCASPSGPNLAGGSRALPIDNDYIKHAPCVSYGSCSKDEVQTNWFLALLCWCLSLSYTALRHNNWPCCSVGGGIELILFSFAKHLRDDAYRPEHEWKQ